MCTESRYRLRFPAAWSVAEFHARPWVIPPQGSRLLIASVQPLDLVIGASRLASLWSRRVGIVDHLCLGPGKPPVCATGETSPALTSDWVAASVTQWRSACVGLGIGRAAMLDFPIDGVLGRARSVGLHLRAWLREGDAIAVPSRREADPAYAALHAVIDDVARRHGATVLEFPVWSYGHLHPSQVVSRADQLLLLPFDRRAETARSRAFACHPSLRRAASPACQPLAGPGLLEASTHQLLIQEGVDPRAAA